MRHVVIAVALLAAGPAFAETATVMGYSDRPFQSNYTAAVLDPYNEQGAATGPSSTAAAPRPPCWASCARRRRARRWTW